MLYLDFWLYRNWVLFLFVYVVWEGRWYEWLEIILSLLYNLLILFSVFDRIVWCIDWLIFFFSVCVIFLVICLIVYFDWLIILWESLMELKKFWIFWFYVKLIDGMFCE